MLETVYVGDNFEMLEKVTNMRDGHKNNDSASTKTVIHNVSNIVLSSTSLAEYS